MIQPPRGMSIGEAYELYRKDKLIVNRRYQRKLVWTIQEKQELIDSILCKYPIPLILLAQDDDGSYEIIDGVQRFNAFFDFIENQFPVNLHGDISYFHVPDYTFAQGIANKKIFKPYSGTDAKFLTQEQVSNFIYYQFPISIYQTANEGEINDIFRRINSHGRHLSPQEVRQAGVTNVFSNLVREIASEIRGDVSKDILKLNEMPEISIDVRNPILSRYGIIAEETFWVKHGVLTANDLRNSEDEQVIADLILSIVFDSPFAASKERFDNYYGKGEKDLSDEVVLKVNAYGYDNLKNDIKKVYSEILHFSDDYLDDKSLKLVLNPSAGGNPIKGDFYAVFMAFHQLMMKSNKMPFEYAGIKKSLTNIHASLTPGKKTITMDDRQKNIRKCTGLIEPYFKKANGTFRSSGSYTLDFQNYLNRSKIESANYDFKQGLYSLDPRKRTFSDRFFEEKIIHNIAALANLGLDSTGRLFIGITDKESDTKQVEKLDNLTSVPRIHGFGIVGLEREAKIRGVTLDQYVSFITDKISKSELPSYLKAKLTKSIIPITYHGFTVLMIKVESGDEPVFYKDKIFVREGASCKEVKGSAIKDVFQLFNK
jgi:hypothetical protein